MEIYEGKRRQGSSKSSRSPSPEAPAEAPSHETFRPVPRTPPVQRVGPPPSPPVPTHPIAPVPPEPPGNLSLLPCQVCGRTFVPQSLAKHVKICEKTAIKKRKTFDSSRQRREGLSASNGVNAGTDLEQYLPKNFGLPENSPFLEKSPPDIPKVAPKPKPSVKSVITKPNADLQKCPHCNRAFGIRAFERHVEWCADKAKILPATTSQTPQVSNAKQRLNARTQYKAPPVRGRRSSRDKSSNSRSASVESRGRSPPPPREYGDYNKQGRLRATESMSSNDHEESLHVPIIRNSRNSNSSGDANVKARQARLARDLSSSRNPHESLPPSVQQSTTDPDIKKNQNKPKNKLSLKKQEQMKKLEEIAIKYNEKQEKMKEELEKRQESAGTRRKMLSKDRSQIPISKKTNVTRKHKRENGIETKPDTSREDDLTSNASRSKPVKSKVLTVKDATAERNDKNKKTKRPAVKKDMTKESTMSLDSLELTIDVIKDQSTQSIGINTELICPCVPCVIHETGDQKIAPVKKNKTEKIWIKGLADTHVDTPEPKVELLYQNLTMVSSCDIRSREVEPDSLEDLSIKFDHGSSMCSNVDRNCNSEKNIPDKSESSNDNHKIKSTESDINTPKKDKESVGIRKTSDDTIKNATSDKEMTRYLSTEDYEEDYERDLSADFEDSGDNNNNTKGTEKNDVICRHGSGDTYTKFTENPDDLDEFINMTDQLIGSHNFNQEMYDLDKEVELFHTPKTISIEAMKTTSDHDLVKTEPTKQIFSDNFEELKSHFKDLLDGAGTNIEEAINESEKIENKRQVNDMEHITVYALKTYEEKSIEHIQTKDTTTKKTSYEFRLPAITDNNKPERKATCDKKKLYSINKNNRKCKLLTELNRINKDYQTFGMSQDDTSDGQSISAEAPPLKLPRIDNKRIDENYDPFASAARQMKELLSPETNLPKKLDSSCKDSSRTLPLLRPAKEKSSLSYLRSDNTKMMKDSLNKTYQKTPTLQRMKSFGSTNNETNNNTFGGRCSSFRLNRSDKKSSQTKLNTTFTKSSKENISTTEKSLFNRNSNLNRSFSSYNATAYSTPKPKDKIPKIATSMYHSFQRSTIKQPVKLDKIKRDADKKEFVNLDAILADDNSSMTDSNYIDPRLINENDNLPINVNTILNNPDIISSMESLLTTENLPIQFESFNTTVQNNNIQNIGAKTIQNKNDKIETNNNINKVSAPALVDDLSAQYDKIMSSLEQSINSKTSIRDDDSLCEDFDLEEFMTSFDEEIHKHKETKRTCSSTTRVVKPADFIDSNRTSELNSISSTPKLVHSGSNGLLSVNKSNSFNFSSNNIVSESLFPSSVKRSSSFFESIQKKNAPRAESVKSRHKSDQLEQDIMQSLKEFDQIYDSERNEINQTHKEVNHNITEYNSSTTTKRQTRVKSERKSKKAESVSNGNFTPNGKSADSAYSSLNRISPSKLSVCNSKELNGAALDNIPAGSDSSGCQKDDLRSVSSEEFLAMERSAELDEPVPSVDAHTPHKEENPVVNEKRVNSRSSSRRESWRRELSSSESEASLPVPRRAPAPRPSRFCHECGSKFPVETAKFCIECGVKRLIL